MGIDLNNKEKDKVFSSLFPEGTTMPFVDDYNEKEDVLGDYDLEKFYEDDEDDEY